MFKRAREISRPVYFRFNEQTITADDSDTIAAALLAAGITRFRFAPEDQSERGPLCMIGNCFECLVEIEGKGSRQACRERITEGMQVRSHPGLPDPGEKS
ncbi:MAG: (2Fe-2S)-binding protein [Rhodobacteraceae bacterium]|nr:(2Fe-2S)-binding protein [Paracoccaceae bacterium]